MADDGNDGISLMGWIGLAVIGGVLYLLWLGGSRFMNSWGVRASAAPTPSDSAPSLRQVFVSWQSQPSMACITTTEGRRETPRAVCGAKSSQHACGKRSRQDFL
jgi:hypothetical protein